MVQEDSSEVSAGFIFPNISRSGRRLLLSLGTFVVNVAGCFMIGLFYGLFMKYSDLSPAWRLFLTTGFCGGFTTFSTFSYENIALLRDGQYVFFFRYTGASLMIRTCIYFSWAFAVKSDLNTLISLNNETIATSRIFTENKIFSTMKSDVPFSRLQDIYQFHR